MGRAAVPADGKGGLMHHRPPLGLERRGEPAAAKVGYQE